MTEKRLIRVSLDFDTAAWFGQNFYPTVQLIFHSGAKLKMEPRPKPCSRWVTGLLALSALIVLASSLPVQAQQPPDYKIHAGDELEIAVWKEEELLRKVIVRPDGKFGFPLTGEIVAANRSVADIQAEIEQRLKKYIPDPVVTVSVTGIQGNRIFVIGQVTRPGLYVMNPQLNVLQALSVAGGTTPYAALNEIIVLRGSGPGQKTLPFRYSDVSKGRSLEQNIQLESGDVIVVP